MEVWTQWHRHGKTILGEQKSPHCAHFWLNRRRKLQVGVSVAKLDLPWSCAYLHVHLLEVPLRYLYHVVYKSVRMCFHSNSRAYSSSGDTSVSQSVWCVYGHE